MILERPAPAATEPLRLVAREPQAPAAGMLLLRVAACGVCRTDLQLCEGDLAMREAPIVPGHQIVGYVEAVGAEVAGWEVGDRAGVAWLAGTDGTCDKCRSGRENLCAAATFTGWDVDGGYATHAIVRADFALRDPDGLRRCRRGAAAVRRRDRLPVAQAQRNRSRWPPGPLRLRRVCADHAAGRAPLGVPRLRRDPLRRRARARAVAGRGVGGRLRRRAARAARRARSPSRPRATWCAPRCAPLDRGATVAINAIHLDRLPEMPYDELWWERRLASVANFTRADAAELLALAAQIPIRTTFETHPLADANVALTRLSRGEVDGAAVLVP